MEAARARAYAATMTLATRSFLVCSLLAVGPLTGCFFGPSASENPTSVGSGGSPTTTTTSGEGGSGGAPDQQTQDIAQYNALQAKLAKTGTMVGNSEGMAGIQSGGSFLFWYQFQTDSPTLHSLNSANEKTTDYTFSIGDSCSYNYRTSENLVVTADTNGGYYAYDITKPNSSVGTLMVTPPSSDVMWWAYAPDGSDVYYVTTEGGNILWKWTPPATTPVQVLDLDDTGATIGEFDDFGVSGNTMVFLADGAVWSLDIAAKKSTFLGNKTEDTTGAEIDTDGVLFPTDTGAYFFSYATMQLRDLGAAIKASSYKLNDTYSTAHLLDPTRSGLGRYQSNVVYFGAQGIFTFDMTAGTVAPVLLDALDDSTVFVGIAVLTNGMLYTTGLQSTEGDIGTDGPVYQVQLAP
jgi:hypothetical protein